MNQIRKHCGMGEPRASEHGSRAYSGLNDKGHCSALAGRRGEYSAIYIHQNINDALRDANPEADVRSQKEKL